MMKTATQVINCFSFNFGQAIELMKLGYKVQRASWVTQNKFAKLNPMETPDFGKIPWIGVTTEEGYFIPYVPTQTDMLAADWGAISE
jgi:hypothetical protein